MSLPNDVKRVIRDYVGYPTVSCNRGKLEWEHVHIELQFHNNIKLRDWAQYKSNLATIVAAYIKTTPFYFFLRNDSREFFMLLSNPNPNVLECLLRIAQEKKDAMAQCQNGVFMEWPPQVHFEIRDFVKLIGKRFNCEIQHVAASCIPKDFFGQLWVKNVGPDGYLKHPMYHQNGLSPQQGAIVAECSRQFPEVLPCWEHII